MFAFVALLFIAAAHSASAIFGFPTSEARCACMIAIPQVKLLQSYSVGRTYNATESFSKAESMCDADCTSMCANSLLNGANLCRLIDGNFDNSDKRVGCYSTLATGTGYNILVHPFNLNLNATINGCKKTCTCPAPAQYDVIRASCVKAAVCTTVPGMPDGGKGGGYFARAGKLYVDVPGSVCKVSAL